MSTQEENEIIVREFKKRGRRSVLQVLAHVRSRLTRRSGWHPRLQVIVERARQLGIKVTGIN